MIARGRRKIEVGVATALAVVGALCLGTVAVVVWGDSAPAGSRLPTITVGGDPAELSVTWLGDTMLGDEAQPLIDRLGIDWITQRVPPPEADVVVANLEGPITRRTEVWDPAQRWTYQSDPSVAAALARAGVDVASLANNHAMDRGPEGLADTMTNLTHAGIRPIGAGASSAESQVPLLVSTPAGTLAIAAFAETDKGSGPDRPGVRRLSRENLESANLMARRAGATWVAAFVHWGENYEPITGTQRQWAAAFGAAGYDLVIGAGPHLVQPIELVGRMPVVYSIGNWAFGTPGRHADFGVLGHSVMLTTKFSSDGLLTLTATCIVTDNQLTGYQPQPCASAEAVATLSGLNGAMHVENDRGTMVVPVTPAGT